MTPEQVLEAAFVIEAPQYAPISRRRRGSLRLRSLLKGVRLEVSETTPTLEIQAVRRGYVLRLGRSFCEEFVLTSADARAVLAHELLHAVRGHLRTPFERHPGLRTLQNLAMDVLVNAAVLMWGGLGSHPGIFRLLYPPTEFPGCLLLPPTDLLPFTDARGHWESRRLERLRTELLTEPGLEQEVTDAVGRHFASLGVRHAEAFARAYRDGWMHFPEPAAYWERLRALFVAEYGTDPAPLEIVLLGNHGEAARRDKVAGRDAPACALGEQIGDAEAWFAESVPPQPTRADLDRFGRQVVTALDRAAEGASPSQHTATIPTPIPMPGRRDLPLIALGQYPAIWHPARRRVEPERMGIRVYIDVSGSMNALCPLLFALTRALGPRLDLPVWAWSLGPPAPISAEDLAAGRYLTRGGTDFGPTATHAVERGFRRILVLTDGHFRVAPGLATLITEGGLEITFVVNGLRHSGVEHHLAAIAKHVFALGRD